MSRKSAIMLKGFSLAVSAAMIASVMQIPVYAVELLDGRIAIEAGGGQKTITEQWGDVHYSGQDGNGVDVTANEGSYAVVTTGKVQTDGIPEGSGFSGVYAYSENAGMSTAEVKGVQSSACGIKAESEGEGSRSSIKVEGDIDAKGNGIETKALSGAEADATVEGDVTSKEGFGITGTTIDGELNITVDGTVSGGKGGVYTADDGSGFTLTVWKIEPDEQGALAFGMNDEEYVENTAFERTIKYIIRLDQPTAGATLSVTDKNGNALSKIVSSENTYEYAYAGATVLLKVDLAEGYDLLGAYNNDGKATELLKDADGNYYIVVPKGGGVSLSVEVKKAEPKKPDEDDDYVMEAAAMQGTAATIEAAPVSVRNQLLSKIIDAPTNAHIVFLTNESPILDKEIMDMLEIRRDISLTISYVLQGKRYIVDIPAGYPIDSLRIKEGIYAGQGNLTLKAYSSVEQVSVKALPMP